MHSVAQVAAIWKINLGNEESMTGIMKNIPPDWYKRMKEELFSAYGTEQNSF